jgi:hypothetical protein
MKISELYGKAIENNTKKGQGYVYGTVVCGDKITYLLCFDMAERQFFVDAKDVISVGEKIIYDKKADTQRGGIILKLGRGCYTESGKFLGILSDCLIDGFTIKKAQIGNKNFLFSRIVCGDIYIIKDNKGVEAQKNTAENCTKTCNNCSKNCENTGNSCGICPHELFINALCN